MPSLSRSKKDQVLASNGRVDAEQAFVVDEKCGPTDRLGRDALTVSTVLLGPVSEPSDRQYSFSSIGSSHYQATSAICLSSDTAYP